MPWNWILQKLEAEESVIAGAPLHFALAVLCVGILIWMAVWRIYRERIVAKNDITGMYKDRFGSIGVDVNKSPIGKLRNYQLKKRADLVAKAIEQIGEQLAIDCDKVEWPPRTGSSTTINDVAANHIAASAQANAAYGKDIKQDGLLLRSEIKSRLQSLGISDTTVLDPGESGFESPTNPIGFRMVASELRRLAKLLPR